MIFIFISNDTKAAKGTYHIYTCCMLAGIPCTPCYLQPPEGGNKPGRFFRGSVGACAQV